MVKKRAENHWQKILRKETKVCWWTIDTGRFFNPIALRKAKIVYNLAFLSAIG